MSTMNANIPSFDLIVIGSGLAGLAAARRAAHHGLRTAVLSATPGSLPYTSGALDLLAVYPTETKRYRDRPWEALSELCDRDPHHPYGRLGLGAVRAAMDDVLDWLGRGPLAYVHQGDTNQMIIIS